MKRRLFSWAVALLLCLSIWFGFIPAQAEDCFIINVDTLSMDSLRDNDYVAQYLSAQTQGVRVQKYISNSDELAARVRLTIQQMDTNTLVFDKNFGYQSGTFDSGAIYLPFVDNRTIPYLVTLYVEDWVYAMPFMHLQSRLMFNGACTYGVRMRDYNPSLTSDWLMGTMLDLDDLRARGSIGIPICASNAYVVGQVTVVLSGDLLRVELAFSVDAGVEVNQCRVYCVKEVAQLHTADPMRLSEQAYAIGEEINVYGASTVLLYIPMTISYEPAGLPMFGYDPANDGDLQRQLALWNQNLMGFTAQPDDTGREPIDAIPEVPIGQYLEETIEENSNEPLEAEDLWEDPFVIEN